MVRKEFLTLILLGHFTITNGKAYTYVEINASTERENNLENLL